ncbi:response regulator transcription factor [Corynebacterium sp.]|uniref:response regulator transcription factor n=1 Tax=Corynebacterium sp. TaxID=1720 RepID=UPI0026DEB410|nr:response regulator transcription factor [Corynebacterium sp.]MDO5512949.1 response regulator transcription factor [Corynebacterium sp.]
MISVLIVDDDPLVLETLPLYLHSAGDLRVVATARHGRAALEALDETAVDVILADIHMPVMNGRDLLHHVHGFADPPAFVAMTGVDTDESMLSILAQGGSGYIIKSARPEEYIAAIRDATKGGTTVSPQAMSRLRDYLPTPGDEEVRRLWDTLSELDRCILHELCTGKSNADIARALHYSESTIKRRLSHLAAQFAASSRLELAVTLLNAHIVS